MHGATMKVFISFNTMFIKFEASNHQCSCKHFHFILMLSAWCRLPSFAETHSWSIYQWNKVFISVAQHPNLGSGRLIVVVYMSHTVTHSPGRTPLEERSVRLRGRCLHNAQQTQEKNIHAISGIRNRGRSNQETVHVRRRPHGHRWRRSCVCCCTVNTMGLSRLRLEHWLPLKSLI